MLEKHAYFDQETAGKIVGYVNDIETFNTPDDVLNRLDDIISQKNSIRVHGANRFSVKVGDWRRIELGKNAFVHRDVPKGWVEEWIAFVTSGHPLGLMTARICLAPFSWTELFEAVWSGRDRPMALRARAKIRHTRWVRVPGWRAMGGGVLVPRGSRQLLHTTGAWSALHGRQFGSYPFGTTSWSRRRACRFKCGPDRKGAVGIATGFNWFDDTGNGNGAWPG